MLVVVVVVVVLFLLFFVVVVVDFVDIIVVGGGVLSMRWRSPAVTYVDAYCPCLDNGVAVYIER